MLRKLLWSCNRSSLTPEIKLCTFFLTQQLFLHIEQLVFLCGDKPPEYDIVDNLVLHTFKIQFRLHVLYDSDGLTTLKGILYWGHIGQCGALFDP